MFQIKTTEFTTFLHKQSKWNSFRGGGFGRMSFRLMRCLNVLKNQSLKYDHLKN